MSSLIETDRDVRQLKEGDRTIVIGGGPAGLTAAYLLAKRGYSTITFEGTDMVGGISQTAMYNGYRFDIGGHRFFTKITPVQNLWEEILGDDFISVPRMSRIHYQGKFFNYPLVARNVLQNLGIGVLPDYVTQDFPDLIQVLPDLTSADVPVFLAYPEELRHSQRVSAFKDFVQDEIITYRKQLRAKVA